MRLVSFVALTAISIVFIVSVIAVANASAVQDYSYFKSHTIMGSPDGVLHNYQVRFVVHSGDGTDYGQDVYLGGRSQSWPNDIRFTDNAGNLLSYWIESFNASDAIIWVNVDDIPASPAAATIDIYYGKQDDKGASNGDVTFTFFDDFNNSVIDNAKWGSPSNTTTVSENGGVLRIIAGNFSPGYLPTLNDFSDCVIEERVRAVQSEGTHKVYHILLMARVNGDSYVQAALRGMPDDDLYIYDGSFEAGPVPFENLAAGTGQWHRFTFTLSGDYVTAHVLNEATGASKTVSGTTTAIAPGKIAVETHETGITNEVDYIFVRKYTPNTPINGGWGVETVTQTPIPQWLTIIIAIFVIIIAIILLVALGLIFGYVLGKHHK